MANTEQLELLKQGVTKWNQWRESNSDAQLNLIEANLSGFNLRKVNLSEADLRGADLSSATLSGADLSSADLGGADLSHADLSYTNLSSAHLSYADLFDLESFEWDSNILPRVTNLRGADLRGADLRGADLSSATLSDADLGDTNLRGADLCGADLSSATLSDADLGEAKLEEANLRGSDLSRADLRQARLGKANLSRANLSRANLSGVNLSEVNLSEVNLSGAHLSKATLSRVDLSDANLSRANLSGSDLSGANLSGSDLSGANLIKAQVLGTKLEESILTGACLEDWNINSATNFEGALCQYVYLQANQQERRPREGNFRLGEFAALFQQAIDTVDLIFKDGIDWQAFFKSFQDLRSQYADQDLSIQGIEKKRGGAFIVRLEVPDDIDKTAVEEKVKALYGEQLKQIEEHYQQQLHLQGRQLDDYRSQVQQQQHQNSRLLNIVETMAEKDSASKYDLRGAQFAGGFAETVQGNQIGGTINNYGPNTEDITRLLTALRDQAQTFPTDQKDEATDVLHNLERDLKEEKPDQGRIGRNLKKLMALALAITSGAVAFSGDLTAFSNNVQQLAENLNIPIEQIQPTQLPPSNTP